MNMHIKYTVYVYPGREHWHKPINELTESFCTKNGAKQYVKPIKSYNKNYVFWLENEDTRNGEYI